MIREALPNEEIGYAEFVYRHGFMSMDHNYLCAVCRERPAVIICDKGVLQPCWKCTKDLEYALIRAKTKFQKLLIKLFFKELC